MKIPDNYKTKTTRSFLWKFRNLGMAHWRHQLWAFYHIYQRAVVYFEKTGLKKGTDWIWEKNYGFLPQPIEVDGAEGQHGTDEFPGKGDPGWFRT